MALVERHNGRNFGYARQLSHAGRQALKDLFACSHVATVKVHGDRSHPSYDGANQKTAPLSTC